MAFLDDSINFDHEDLMIDESSQLRAIDKDHSTASAPANSEYLKAISQDAINMVNRFTKDYTENN